MTIIVYHRDHYEISTDPARLDIPLIHDFLAHQSYWAQNRPIEVIRKASENSLNFGIYDLNKRQDNASGQVGHARVVTDYATFAWLCDVFILPSSRKDGLGKWLIECVVEHPELQSLRRFLLATSDAHELYRKYGGFTPLANPERWMERFNPNPFAKPASD